MSRESNPPLDSPGPFDVLGFDIRGPLPTGTTVLEASAGTGKTYAVAALVARFVAEGRCRLDEMLIITFGRAASQELRERVREQLVELARLLAGGVHDVADHPIAELLLEGSAAEVALRHQRIAEALADFDAATIATTHQFCQEVLASLGVAADTDPSTRLVENLDDLLVETASDIYLQRYAQLPVPPMDFDQMLSLAREVFADPHAQITPSDPPLGSASQERVEVAHEVRKRMDERKRQLGILSFDDLLSQLAAALDTPDSPAAARMTARWKVVLVDEFQDTDPVQWRVLQQAFDGTSVLVLIGDPKQAIYAFRGGDIDSYLHAVATAQTRKTLATNYRSDRPLVDALQVLTRGAELGDESIVVQPVTAARSGSRLVGAPHCEPVRMRLIDSCSDGKPAAIQQLRAHIARDLANDVAELLSSEATFDGGSSADSPKRPVRAGDVAILMHSLKQVDEIRQQLSDRGIASVVADRASVLASDAARYWLQLIQALERQSPERVRSVAVTPIFGRTAEELVVGGDRLTDELADGLRDLLDLFRLRGIPAVREALMAGGMAARVLSLVNGERLLTDLEHVGEILHRTAKASGWGLAGLAAWLAHERREAERRPAAVADRHRRLDTDQTAVHIVTIHSSKGLQYPVVYLPFAFNRWLADSGDETALLYHAGGERCLDVASPFDRAVVAQARAEEAAEELRLTYVALTRAQSQIVAWWGRSRDARNSGLSRLLLGREAGEATVPAVLDVVPEMTQVKAKLARWQELGGLVVESATSSWCSVDPGSGDDTVLHARTWSRAIDTHWRRTSYSGLLRAAADVQTSTLSAQPSTEPEVEGTIDEDSASGDEGDTAGLVSADSDTPIDPSPMSELPAGAVFGSLVHAVFEHADPQAADLSVELARVAGEQLRWWPVDASVDDLVAGLVPVHTTPMGPLFDDRTLRDIGQADRLNELDFEMPLAGGDRTVEQVTVEVIADALRSHLDVDDVLAGYADQLSVGLGQLSLRGYLSGSIDAVMRVGSGVDQRFVVVDYKTNRLGVPGEPISAFDFTPDAMTRAMTHAHYPLQALLYSVVAHRYLRWRLPSYDPQRHLGGVAYLFVRGMVGPDTPLVDGMRCGVFAWRPPAALVTELSDRLAGGHA